MRGVVRIPDAHAVGQKRLYINAGIAFGVFQIHRPVCFGMLVVAFQIEVAALGWVGIAGTIAVDRVGKPCADFVVFFLGQIHCAGSRAHQLLTGDAHQLGAEKCLGMGRVLQTAWRGQTEEQRDGAGGDGLFAPVSAKQNDDQQRGQRREDGVVAQQRHRQADAEQAGEVPFSAQKRFRRFSDFPQGQAEHGAQPGEQRILDGGNGQHAVIGQDRHRGRQQQRCPERHALL